MGENYVVVKIIDLKLRFWSGEEGYSRKLSAAEDFPTYATADMMAKSTGGAVMLRTTQDELQTMLDLDPYIVAGEN